MVRELLCLLVTPDMKIENYILVKEGINMSGADIGRSIISEWTIPLSRSELVKKTFKAGESHLILPNNQPNIDIEYAKDIVKKRNLSLGKEIKVLEIPDTFSCILCIITEDASKEDIIPWMTENEKELFNKLNKLNK